MADNEQIEIWADDPETPQVWYLDDSAAVGRVPLVAEWFSRLKETGPHHGYFLNYRKTVMIAEVLLKVR